MRKIFALSAVAFMLLTGCENDGKKEAEIDYLGILPLDLIRYEGEIDVFIYIEGQNGTMTDIGNKEYEPLDLFDPYMARFVASAQVFNRYVPGAKINLNYTSISNYNQQVAAYETQFGHLPHVMHPVDSIYQMIEKGYATDLSIYKESAYYDIFDESIMSIYNYGGFQAAVPYMIYPMGIFVNTGILEDNYIEYDEEYVKNFTMERFYSDLETVTNDETAGISTAADSILSVAVPSIYRSYSNEKSIKLDTTLIRELLALESTITNYTAYTLNEQGNWVGKTNYNVQSWNGNSNFIKDEAYAFSADAAWALLELSKLAAELEKEEQFDILPYPKVSEDIDAYVGMLAGGLVIGNQCPLGEDKCSDEAKLDRDIAALFAMFMNADPRAIEAKSKIQYTDGNKENIYTGIIDMPMVKQNYYYTWEDSEDRREIFGYQLELFLKNYKMYWYADDENSVPDVVNYSNFKPGFKQVIDIFYNNPERRVNYYNRPSLVPDGSSTKQILADWQQRYIGEGDIRLGDSRWLGWVESNLEIWEKDINENIDISYAYLQEQLDMYYGSGKYAV